MGRPFGKVDKQDLVRKKIGKLTVVEYAGKRNRGKIKYDYYLCKCECGNEKLVVRSSLLKKKVKSCGCLRTSKNIKNAFVPKVQKLEKTNGNTIKVYKLNPNELDAYLKELKTKEVQYAGVRGW